MQMRPTFQDLDRIAAAKETKCRELIDRLVKLYVKNLDFDELVFARAYNYGQVFNESYEVARNQLEAMT
jgi:hypothetical protein